MIRAGERRCIISFRPTGNNCAALAGAAAGCEWIECFLRLHGTRTRCNYGEEEGHLNKDLTMEVNLLSRGLRSGT